MVRNTFLEMKRVKKTLLSVHPSTPNSWLLILTAFLSGFAPATPKCSPQVRSAFSLPCLNRGYQSVGEAAIVAADCLP